MTHKPASFEGRIAALISAYADRAPVDVDPYEMTRLVTSAPVPTGRQLGKLWSADRGLVFILVIVALLVALVIGAIAVGGQLARREPEDLLAPRAMVEPFTGLLPRTVAPSATIDGELVLAFMGRLQSAPREFLRMWVYADGRLIWLSEGGLNGRTLANAVVEQRLTPVGVDALRAWVAAGSRVVGPTDIGADRAFNARPGVIWGSMMVATGDQIVEVAWDDPNMPPQLADSAAWLPAGAWADRRMAAYVPARYAVCVWSEGSAGPPDGRAAIEFVPDRVQSIVHQAGVRIGQPEGTAAAPDCYSVRVESAWEIDAALHSAGHEPDDQYVGPRYALRGVREPAREITIDIVPIVPHGFVVCNCG